MSSLVSYGGDPRVVASRAEIERITSELAQVQRRLEGELTLLAQLHGIVHHLQLDANIPETLVRLGLQRHSCFVAAENYFSTDAKVAHVVEAAAGFIAKNQWVRNLIPRQAWVTLGVGTLAAGFTNTNVTALGANALASSLPLNRISNSVTAVTHDVVTVAPTFQISQSTPPTSLHNLAERLRNHSGNIRIESYSGKRGRTLVLFLPGTAQWNPVGGHKAFDLQSDLELIGDGTKSNSYRAANAALSAFGAKYSDRLLVVGYSQGGLVGAELAAKHHLVGLVTMGSPIANEHIPNDVPVISLEHSNDVVPALSGKTNPIEANWVTASRHIQIAAGQTVFEAHEVRNYVETAALADESTDAGVVRVRDQILAQLSGAKLERVEEYAPTKEGAWP